MDQIVNLLANHCIMIVKISDSERRINLKLLNLFELSSANRKQLAQIPDLEIIDPEQVTPSLITKISAIYGWNQLGTEVLNQSTQLRFVQSNSAGVDYLPLKTFKQKGILLANVSGIHAEPISETVIAYVLAFVRGVLESEHAKQQSKWIGDQIRPTITTLHQKVAAIYGTGHIGQEIANKLKVFGVKTIGISRHGHPAAIFDQVFTDHDAIKATEAADIIINIMPLTEQTHHFFDRSFFETLTNQPLFINVGRGPSVDTEALVSALQAGKLSGAGLDVYEQEPLATDSPLWGMANVIMTPHISGGFVEYGDAAFAILRENLQSILKNDRVARNQVDLSEGY